MDRLGYPSTLWLCNSRLLSQPFENYAISFIKSQQQFTIFTIDRSVLDRASDTIHWNQTSPSQQFYYGRIYMKDCQQVTKIIWSLHKTQQELVETHSQTLCHSYPRQPTGLHRSHQMYRK